MSNFYIYYTGGTFRIEKNIGATEFYVYTQATGVVEPTGLPGIINNYYIVSYIDKCNSNPSNLPPVFYWSPPVDTGGGTITGYHIRKVDYNIVSGASGIVRYSGIPDSVISGVYNGPGETHDITTLKYTASGLDGCPGYYEIAAINSLGTGEYALVNGGVQDITNASYGGLTSYAGFAVNGCSNVTSEQSGNFVNVDWPSGVVGCTGNYYQAEIKIYDYSTQTDTGVRANSVNPYRGSVNLTSLTKNKYYYPVITEFHYVGFNPTGCSEVIPSYSCDRRIFWYA